MKMKIPEILDSTQSYLQQVITIEGFLMDLNEYSYIAPDEERFDKINESILISEPGFSEKLFLSDAPPSGGWITSYPYNIVIEGMLCPSENPLFFASLKEIKSAYLEMNGDKFQVV